MRLGRSIQVALIGADFMARGIALQIATATRGMRVAAIVNRDLAPARRACEEAGGLPFREVDSPRGFAARGRSGRRGADAGLASRSARLPAIDVVVEVTGSLDYARRGRARRRSPTASTSS